ncbi:hypothetical protein NX059_004048 [Plenodomus lindquistii]|nr:hypothetical protein NX059_004048 [Plenodomus lindquistii]
MLAVLEHAQRNIQDDEHDQIIFKKPMGKKYNGFSRTTIRRALEKAAKVNNELKQTLVTSPSRQDPTSKKQYSWKNFSSLAVIAVPIGHTIVKNGEVADVVYAYMDANDTIHYVNSAAQHVRIKDVAFYIRAIALRYEREIAFRRAVAKVLTLSFYMPNPPATFAELELAHRDLTKVPILVSELGKMGHLGQITSQQVDSFRDEQQNRLREVLGEITSFFSYIPGDERASLPLLVRALATLTGLMELREDIKFKVTEALTSRWVWLTMCEIVDLTTEQPTFSTTKDEAGWVDWAISLNVTEPTSDDDTCFLGAGVSSGLLAVGLWPKIIAFCPVAAHRPLAKPETSRDVLAKGILACAYAPDPENARVIRCMQPLWSVHYDECMRELYGDTRIRRLPPVGFKIPKIHDHVTGDDAGVNTMMELYYVYMQQYSDGRPEGSNYIIIAWLEELFHAVTRRASERFWSLVDLHSYWEKEGKLAVAPSINGVTESHLQDLRNTYNMSTGNESSDGYTHASDRQRRQVLKARQRAGVDVDSLGPEHQKKRPNLIQIDSAGRVQDRTGNTWEREPINDLDQMGMLG